MWWRKQNRELDTEEDEVSYHLLGRDTSAFREMVRDIEEGGPNSTDHLCRYISTRAECIKDE
jgi:hypothetical protein